jgi:cell pole-organizing protein PopZ
MRQDGEPSVEEILESIKKVIARDNRDLADAQRRQREAASMAQPRAATVQPPAAEPLHTQPAPSQPADDATRSAIMREMDDVLDLSGMFVAEGEADGDELADDQRDDLSGGAADGDYTDEGLTNRSAADAMRQSLAALAMLAEPPAAPRIVRSGETSLEGLVREMLRPMMAQWLDAHLPEIVERLVKAEIARIAGKKR